jgi:hypothetical protein
MHNRFYSIKSTRNEPHGNIILNTFLEKCVLQTRARCKWLRTVVPNMLYAYPLEYAAYRLVVRGNNIGNGGKKKGVKSKSQKQSYEVLVYKDRLM